MVVVESGCELYACGEQIQSGEGCDYLEWFGFVGDGVRAALLLLGCEKDELGEVE
jgi:hypothetical protein